MPRCTLASRLSAPLFLASLLLAASAHAAEPASSFTPLVKLPAANIVSCAEEYPASNFLVGHLIDDRELTEFASHGKGLDTFVVFDFGRSVTIAGFKHIDRKDPATVDEAELVFSDQSDFSDVIARETIDHANAPGAVTVALFSTPHTARFVRWQATRLNAQGHACVGGREMSFFSPEPVETTLRRDQVELMMVPALQRGEEGPIRPLTVKIHHAYAESVEASLQVGDLAPVPLRLQFGTQSTTVYLPAPKQQTSEQQTGEQQTGEQQTGEQQTVSLVLQAGDQTISRQEVELAPVRPWELHFLAHSHVDIGYTHVQTEVEQNQWDHLRQAMQIARRTADYPPESRFKWNSEVLWAVDSYLRQASEEEKAEFLQAVRGGVIHLDGLYGNQLTALCRPEELMRLTGCARRIASQYDLTIDAAMISDVPGYTWGTVPVLVQSGIKYLSIGPNHVHRIGSTLDAWGDRPFYWVSPSGEERLLCWMAGKAYSWFHSSRVDTLSQESQGEPFFEYLEELAKKDYPYDMVQVRYSVGGDNGPPDQELSEFVKSWNEKYIWPRMVVSTTSQLMRTFEERYGDQLPEVRGDFTPYWEDGAGSSARETATNRNAAERLVQAEALWAMLTPAQYPSAEFEAAWREALLYDEHTWGAHCSISQPDSPFTLSQWEIKQAFAVNAERRSRELLEQAFDESQRQEDPAAARKVNAVDVWNTTSWVRSDLVTLTTDLPLVGYVVKDMQGNVVPSMLTRREQLAFVAQDVPPLAAKRYLLEPGPPSGEGSAKVEGHTISNRVVRVEIDPATGAIASLRREGISADLVDKTRRGGLNHYCYVAGRQTETPAANRVNRIEALGDQGLTASLGIFSQGPGVKQLITIVRVIDGIDRVDIINLLDKEKVLDKEAVHLGFPFQVPDGTMRVDIPWAVIRPELDQMAGACKNYLTVGRWVDVSNDQYGVTWATLDAPLIEVGGIHMDVPDPFSAEAWIQRLEPTQTLYSYVMNNYWETNYKASQDGMTRFRYSLRPHLPYDQAEAARFATQCSQPLIARPADRSSTVAASRLQVTGEGVLVTSLKPSDDGKALMVRLFNAGSQPAEAAIDWPEPRPAQVTLSSPREEVGQPLSGSLQLPSLGIATVRAELNH